MRLIENWFLFCYFIKKNKHTELCIYAYKCLSFLFNCQCAFNFFTNFWGRGLISVERKKSKNVSNRTSCNDTKLLRGNFIIHIKGSNVCFVFLLFYLALEFFSDSIFFICLIGKFHLLLKASRKKMLLTHMLHTISYVAGHHRIRSWTIFLVVRYWFQHKCNYVLRLSFDCGFSYILVYGIVSILENKIAVKRQI